MLLNAESGSSSKGANRQIVPSPGGCKGRSRKEGVRGTAPRIFLDDFLSIFGKNVLVLKDRILGNTEFQKPGGYMTGRPDNLSLSLRDVFNDVSKY